MRRVMTIEEQDLDRAIVARAHPDFMITQECVFAQALKRNGIEFSGCAFSGYTPIGVGISNQGTVPVPGIGPLVNAFDAIYGADQGLYKEIREMLPLTVEWDDEKRGV